MPQCHTSAILKTRLFLVSGSFVWILFEYVEFSRLFVSYSHLFPSVRKQSLRHLMGKWLDLLHKMMVWRGGALLWKRIWPVGLLAFMVGGFCVRLLRRIEISSSFRRTFPGIFLPNVETHLLSYVIWHPEDVARGKGKGKVIPLQARCGLDGG